jgi:predicted nucleic acid-binding protein
MTGPRANGTAVGDVFVDTNIFVYAQDKADTVKQAKALELIRDLAEDGRIVISTQVLQEFASVAVRKLGLLLPQTNALLDELAKLPTCNIDAGTIKDAVVIHFANRLSFFDSLTIATAVKNGCTYVYSEDLADGQTIRGVTIVNPFV